MVRPRDLGRRLGSGRPGRFDEGQAEPDDLPGMVESRTGLYTVPEVLMSTDGKTWCSLGRPGSRKASASGVAPLADGRLLAIGSGLTENKKALRPIAFVADTPVCVPLEPSDTSNTETPEPTESPTAN